MRLSLLISLFYPPVCLALVISALVAIYRLRTFPERYSYCFPTERTKAHFVAGT